ncbi:MAG: hypothetical protein A6D92_07160 [Symbiobacterium thermophilum]|uniref:ATP-dependent DNA ligase family profile domain-containing protein n=1 Tax=Symbiobacterium thermophilum TaxID=2734 RepID=A0A1Y2T810_SYMTR|nr:MAG: hypothetical protein A6D92_07160 [Symbiobacterium thermophilum]
MLDGEIIVLQDGRPSFSAVLERDLAGSTAGAARRRPATLMLFDLLEWDGRELYDVPLAERLALLEAVVPPDEAWQVVSSFPGSDGPALFTRPPWPGGWRGSWPSGVPAGTCRGRAAATG